MLDKQELAQHFSRNLLRIRKEAGFSQEALGFLAGLHRTEIGMLERGIRLPRIDTLLKLAGGLEVEPGELLDGMSWRPGNRRLGRFRVEEDTKEQKPKSKSTQRSKPRPTSHPGQKGKRRASKVRQGRRFLIPRKDSESNNPTADTLRTPLVRA